MDEEQRKRRERNKILSGLGLTAIIFAWFLYYFLSHIPE